MTDDSKAPEDKAAGGTERTADESEKKATNGDEDDAAIASPVVPYGGPLPYADDWDAIFAEVDVRQATKLHEARLRTTYGIAVVAQSCAERVGPPHDNDSTLVVYATTKPLLTTREATAYCGFKTTAALRKARLEGRIAPAGRRGGSGTWVWAREDLDRFLRGAPARRAPGRVPATERSGAPPYGGSHGEAEELEVVQGQLDLDRAGAAAGLAAEGGRTRRSGPGDRHEHGPPEGDLEGPRERGRADGAQVDRGRVQARSGRRRLGRDAENALLRLRDIAVRAEDRNDGDQERKRS
jgi:hypothetical protein